jgi:hypothetical protein
MRPPFSKTVSCLLAAQMLALSLMIPSAEAQFVSSRPFGNYEAVTHTGPAVITVTGWAVDPSGLTAAAILIGVDGRFITAAPANFPRPDVGFAYPAFGSARGFRVNLFAVPPGVRNVCVEAVNAFGRTSLGCRTVVVRAGNPFGVLERVTSTVPNETRVQGWVIDPDVSGPVDVHVYVNGRWGGGYRANKLRADIGRVFPGYGNYHGFELTLYGLDHRAQNICVYAINTGSGTNNPLMGCRKLQPVTPVAPIPTFAAEPTAVLPDGLRFNPTQEWSNSSVINVEGLLVNPLGKWYLYTAPHDYPGGITLFYGDSPQGPWTEHVGNPVVSNTWDPHYRVGHVSTPAVVWDPDARALRMWFHGDNDTTRQAISSDGIRWIYQGVALQAGTDRTAREGGLKVSAAGYARVYRHTLPGSTHKWLMLFTDALTPSNLALRVATSPDAINWVVRPRPLFAPGPEFLNRASSPSFLRREGKNLVLFHAPSTLTPGAPLCPLAPQDLTSSVYVYVAEVDNNFNLVKLYSPPAFNKPGQRIAAPEIVFDAVGAAHLFVEFGARSPCKPQPMRYAPFESIL